MWLKLVAAVLVVEPSPKSQKRLVIVPVELSVKFTVNGFKPLVGMPTKLAEGTAAPVPAKTLVLLPPSLVMTTALLKLPAPLGAKRRTRFVEPKPARLKGVPETMLNDPTLTAAVPLFKAAPP